MASFRRRFPDSKHERILRSIIRPRSGAGHESPLDNDSLQSILSAANEVFFNGRLSQRVMWDWSAEGHDDGGRMGTTALRRASTRGFETLIVLSGPMLRGGGYSRRLLISTFLHELVHCYLFICCGFRAREEGGHTAGFRAIARLIDEWAGEESGLHLGSVEADLERFRIDRGGEGGQQQHHHHHDHHHRRHHVYYPCSGVTEEQQHRLPLPLPPPQGQQRTTSGPVLDDEESVSSGASGYASTWWRHQAGAVDHEEEGDDRDSGFDSGGASGSGSPYVYTTADGMSWGG
ncbi:SprT-like family-domain-containing protein [Schizothecium vesticola]|uniref:SprT-like family-domain-containing protein n=1 Tax=Schizothecium vesticola TaxID=314040 RepID=A0AA40K573_9PEZI|nr:SprT-like family-domain-containing protein [Schizothecium vesticola]